MPACCGRSAASVRACRSTVRSIAWSPREAAERWLDALIGLEQGGADVAAAIAQVAARTGDPAREISEAARARAVAHLDAFDAPADVRQVLTDVTPGDRLRQGVHYFGEDLPSGLALVE